MKLAIIAAITLALVLGGCAGSPEPDSDWQYAVATFYPFYDIARNVGGEKMKVFPLVPNGVEPHDYEATPGDIQRVNSAKAFITTGLEFSEYEHKVIEGLDRDVVAIDASRGISLIEAEQTQGASGPEGNHGRYDPHIWVSVRNAMKITANVRDGFIQADPQNAQVYAENAQKYTTQLEALDMEFSARLSNCEKDAVLTSHAAFSYLARDYGFGQIPLLGLSPESEPTSGQIKKLVDEARKNDVKYIFYEELVDPRIAQTIASEVGAQTLVLSPVEGSAVTSDDYISIMRKNLSSLEVALECRK